MSSQSVDQSQPGAGSDPLAMRFKAKTGSGRPGIATKSTIATQQHGFRIQRIILRTSTAIAARAATSQRLQVVF
jgi:hypothetical protein